MFVRKKCPARQNTAPQVRCGRGCVEMLYLRGFYANVTATRILSPFWLDAALFIRVYTNKFHLEIISLGRDEGNDDGVSTSAWKLGLTI